MLRVNIMKYTLVLDSSAALPEYVLKTRPIKILPITIRIDNREFPDIVDEEQLIDIYKSGEVSIYADIDVITPDSELISNYILQEVVPEYDFAICQTIAKTVSPIFDNLSEVANKISKESRTIRENLGIVQPFRMTYLSAGTTVAGQGLLCVYADFVLSRGMDYSRYKVQIEKFKQLTKGYLAINDMVYARHRAKLRGVKTVALPVAVVGKFVGLSPLALNHNESLSVVGMNSSYEKSVNKLFKYARDRLKDGLYFSAINITIAGDPKDLARFSEFSALQEDAKQAKVKLLVGVMSLAASINCGPGTVGMGIAPKNQTAEP